MRSILLAATAAMLIPLSAAAQQQAVPAAPVLLDATLLDVMAEGRSTRVPDLATIRAGVVTQGTTAQAALSENAARMDRVIAALKRAGVADRDLQTATIQLNPQYRYGENVPPTITGYQATNTVSVRFRDVAKSGAILDALVREGANQIDGPNLGVEAMDAAMDEARTDAIRRARARAELYAKAAGLRVERILVIAEGATALPPQPMPQMMMRAEMAKDSQVLPGEQEINATVTVRFLLR
ncbi:SIMPL domain-containing protein [Sphingomonas sp. AX6]|uniref:SIMPL domain-containing protein n=1 Tax=Sphingomonas sp. AX6 TaxID=2653171 RepID=UPI0012F2FA3A|nr:SIMPL domain-containing protein [Sphingomonas sp. AX6]VXC56156.1 putative 26 kDa periplasmic immunogenic protein [Sphingomonas sp. AX6]